MTLKIHEAKDALATSAFDFFYRSVSELESHPKYSVIHFATGVELFLKSRLLNEHWTLVVEKSSEADIAKFLEGKSRTVGLREAIRRLKQVCNENIPNETAAQFEAIAEHRNKMIHFFHEIEAGESDPDLIQNIASEQCLGWYYVDRLLLAWGEQFENFKNDIAAVR